MGEMKVVECWLKMMMQKALIRKRVTLTVILILFARCVSLYRVG